MATTKRAWVDPKGTERVGSELLDQRTTTVKGRGEAVVSLICHPTYSVVTGEHSTRYTIEVYEVATGRTHQMGVPSEAEGRRLMAKVGA